MTRTHHATLSFAVLLVGLCVGSSETQARGKKPARLRALTFNIRFDFPNDGKNRWEHRADLVAKTILDSQAHLVCLQEDKAHQVDDLKKRLPEFEFIGKGRNATGSGERCSIAFNRKHFKAKDKGDFWLSDTPDKVGSNTWGDKYPRKVTWAILEARKSKKILLVLNTHFPEGKRDTLREKGADVMVRWLTERTGASKKKKRRKPVAILVCGDFNSDAGTPPQKAFTAETGLAMRDAWLETPPDPFDPRPGTYNGFRGLKTQQRIDWLLVGGPIRVLKTGKISEPIDGRYPSDHYPVFADLEVH
jgi:endonuclease/exonuclease/phosphatase family metal-dependent hydrolase